MKGGDLLIGQRNMEENLLLPNLVTSLETAHYKIRAPSHDGSSTTTTILRIFQTNEHKRYPKTGVNGS